jgi:hypothetical protein
MALWTNFAVPEAGGQEATPKPYWGEGRRKNEARIPRRGLIMEETLADVPR